VHRSMLSNESPRQWTGQASMPLNFADLSSCSAIDGAIDVVLLEGRYPEWPMWTSGERETQIIWLD
jgi:hypothetical protein